MYRIMPKSKNTLTTTIVGEWIICEDDRKDVDSEMRLFQCAVRTAFNRLLEWMNKGDLEKLVSSRFNINSRYAKDAVMQAQSIQSSQRELVKQHKQEKERAIKGLRKKLGEFEQEGVVDQTHRPLATPAEDYVKSEDKRESISAKIKQLNEEVLVLEGHIENSTIPKVIFGDRENFEKRREGKLSKEDWKSLRNNKLYSRGDKSKEGGNLNARIESSGQSTDFQPFRGFSLSVAISHKVSSPKTAPRVTGKLWVDVRHQERFREHLENGGIYSIELIRGRDNKYRAHITFAESVPIEVVSFLNGAYGVDVNPDGIALTETDSEGNLISSEWMALPELTYSRRTKRDNLIGETAAEVVRIALAKR